MVDIASDPCGLCLRPSRICRIFLSKGKGAKGGLRVDLKRSECPNLVNFKYKIAERSTLSSPCSNVPIQCPICLPSAPAVWRYNFKHHLDTEHPNASHNLYASIWDISDDERKEMKRIWADRRKVVVKRVKKKAVEELVVSEAHRSRIVMSDNLKTQDQEGNEDNEDTGDGSDVPLGEDDDDKNDNTEEDDGEELTDEDVSEKEYSDDGYGCGALQDHQAIFQDGWDPAESDPRHLFEQELEKGSESVLVEKNNPKSITIPSTSKSLITSPEDPLLPPHFGSESSQELSTRLDRDHEEEPADQSIRRSQRKRKAIELPKECVCGTEVDEAAENTVQ
ncbi:hypothetical protein H0H93_013813, partial [Arthromyces matolae]